MLEGIGIGAMSFVPGRAMRYASSRRTSLRAANCDGQLYPSCGRAEGLDGTWARSNLKEDTVGNKLLGKVGLIVLQEKG